MRSRFSILLITSIISFLIISLSFVLPIPFSGISGYSSYFWLFVSNTGGVFGVPIITVIFCLLIAYYFEGWRKRMLSITITLFLFSSILGGFAKLNESFIKEYLKIRRPYAIELGSSLGFDVEKFYKNSSKEKRSEYVLNFIKTKGEGNIIIDNVKVNSKILNHWILESGYSFPSGHSINSFLMAFIIGYVILFIYSDYKRKYLFALPYLWATLVVISRVAVGAHSVLDVIIGAVFGTLIGVLIISTKLVDKLLQQKT